MFYKSPVVVDVETTVFQHGNPYANRNRLCYFGAFDGSTVSMVDVDTHEIRPYGAIIDLLNSSLRRHDLFIAFNAKFDLGWCRRYGIDVSHMFCWDLQLVDFIISGQSEAMPSLNGACHRAGMAGKTDDLAEKYWSNGIDTPEIPQGEILSYLEGDCRAEWDLFLWQKAYLESRPALQRLCWNACQDLLLTSEMEWNGLHFNLALSKELGDACLEDIKAIDAKLNAFAGVSDINWNSGDWISAVLYGGTVLVDDKETYTFVYKSGRTAEKTRKIRREVTFPRLVEPLKNTATAKQGFFQTSEGVLKRLKANRKIREIIDLILERSKLDTKVTRYFHGLPKLYEVMDWTQNKIHGQLNHAVAKTGRLASSKPNQQNFDEEIRKCIQTRFPRT